MPFLVTWRVQDIRWNSWRAEAPVQEITISITRHILPAVVIIALVIWLIKRRKKPPTED